ncbi:PREDICTED: zinc finger protein 449-like [Chrysochloris asiatica]|uniref:Zinc finger protein 449-like n=1 Tax=Chrysochloris asiatica TaxID=185453 RepID=A0A9B0U7A9_CHRAS|nr:PREDICTED: zinc finger protein 449-like [Chrysochloris asiatica]
MAEFLGCTTQASGNHSSTLKQSNDDCEVFRQRFRHFQYQKTAGPREAFNNLWELCSNWLKPKMRSKDEILEQLVLEQFLCVLPMELQTWGKLYRSENRERILSLIEELQKELVVAEQQQVRKECAIFAIRQKEVTEVAGMCSLAPRLFFFFTFFFGRTHM